MRQRRVLLLGSILALAALAGCVGTNTTNTSNASGPDNASNAQADALPEPIEAQETVTGSAEPLAPADETCTSPSAECDEYPFRLNTTATFDAQLTWELENSDFDLYLTGSGNESAGNVDVAISGSEFIGTSEAISTTLEPGEYTILVQASNVAQDTYTLEAVFGHA